MRRLLGFTCAVSLFFSVFAGGRLVADGFVGARQVLRELVAVSKKAGKLGQTVLATTMMVATCAHLLSCDQRDYPVFKNLVADKVEARGLPIMQGVTTANQTQVFVLTTTSSDYAFSLVDWEGDEISPVAIDKDSYQGSAQIVQRVSFQGLMPSSAYLLRVHSGAGELLDERELQTIDLGRQDLRFAFGSCMADHRPQGDIWQQMVALNPDVIFLIGDNVYANQAGDIAAPEYLWMRYSATRSTINLFRSRRLIPVVATWDDHDYGMSNGGRDYPYKEESLSVFKAFFASNNTSNYHMPRIGTASFFSIYGYSFFLLDNRTFRTPVGSSPEWHFGEEQSQWLWNNLVGKDYVFLVSGDQFFGGYITKDSFQGHRPERFLEFLDELADSDAKVLFLSGDRHFTEIMEIPAEVLGYQTYEFTSSPVHSNHRKIPPHNPLRVAGKGSVNNFMLVEASKSSTGLHLKVTSYSASGGVLFSGEYTVD